MKLCTNLEQWRAERAKIGSDSDARARVFFVPTMGALHAGHASLVRQAAELKRRAESSGAGQGLVAVSVFVNPTQFNDPKDLERYPRTLEADAELCREAGADVVYAPSVAEMYPSGTATDQELPRVATRPGLEDAMRPRHFAGVCQVVRRLFEVFDCGVAVFGEKDWQQLRVVSEMVEHEGLDVRIVPGETVREHDGLAMSSRNRFLSQAEREQAGSLWRALARANASAGVRDAEAAMHDELTKAGLKVEYAVVRDALTLMPLAGDGRGQGREARAIIAARLGSVRLIDNTRWLGRQ